MNSPFYTLKRKGYDSQRAVSQGAEISLLCEAGAYVAAFDCARRTAAATGETLTELADGIEESIPCYKIPLDRMQATCKKLSEHHSIALLEYHAEKFNLVWRIPKAAQVITAVLPSQTDLDEF